MKRVSDHLRAEAASNESVSEAAGDGDEVLLFGVLLPVRLQIAEDEALEATGWVGGAGGDVEVKV